MNVEDKYQLINNVLTEISALKPLSKTRLKGIRKLSWYLKHLPMKYRRWSRGVTDLDYGAKSMMQHFFSASKAASKNGNQEFALTLKKAAFDSRQTAMFRASTGRKMVATWGLLPPLIGTAIAIAASIMIAKYFYKKAKKDGELVNAKMDEVTAALDKIAPPKRKKS